MGYWPVVKKVIENCDIIVIVRDARVPELSRNEELEYRIKQSRKLVFEVFNKIDLISRSELEKLRKYYPEGIFTASTKKKGTDILRQKIVEKSSLVNREIRVGVVGYPNMGKSALINALASGHKVRVSSIAGTTKGSQWIRVGKNILIIDTPGVIPFDQKEDELVLLAAKNPERLKDPEKAAFVMLRHFLRYKPELLMRYINEKELPHDVQECLELIARKKNFLLKGGVPDTMRASMQLVRDWQRGSIQ